MFRLFFLFCGQRTFGELPAFYFFDSSDRLFFIAHKYKQNIWGTLPFEIIVEILKKLRDTRIEYYKSRGYVSRDMIEEYVPETGLLEGYPKIIGRYYVSSKSGYNVENTVMALL